MKRLANLREIERKALSTGQVWLALFARQQAKSLIVLRITLGLIVLTCVLTVVGMVL